MGFSGIIVLASLVSIWCSNSKSTQALSAKFKIVPAIYTKKIDDVITYESTSKLVFHVSLPDYTTLFNDETMKSIYVSPNSTFGQIVNLLNADFLDQFNEFAKYNRSSIRRKRQVAVLAAVAGGLTWNYVISPLAKKLFGTDEDVQRYVNKIRDSVSDNQKAMAIMERNITIFANSITEAFKTLQQDVENLSYITKQYQLVVENEISILLKLLFAKIERDWFSESKYACLQNTIPTKMVSMGMLREELNRLETVLKQNGKMLAISINDVSQYHKLPLVDCMMTENKVAVVINVPIKRIDSVWSVFEILHTKFAYNGQVCELYPQESSYLAFSEHKSVLLTSHMLTHCSLHTNKLCLIPEYARDSSESLHCAVGLVKGKSVAELFRYCAFRCSDNSELIINQMDDNVLVITNLKTLNITCNNVSKYYTFDQLGSVELFIQCNCSAVIDDKVLVDAPMYCVYTLPVHDTVFNIIPNLWSTLEYTMGMETHIFSKISNHTYDSLWHQKLPILNLTSLVSTLPEHMYADSLTYKDYWLMLLTILVALSIKLSMFIIWSFIKS